MVNNNAVQPQPSALYSDSLPVIVDVRHVAGFVEFARWAALPRRERKPKTQKGLAELIRMDEDTLTHWKKHPQFWSLVGELLRESMREYTPDIIGGLRDRILAGDGGAADVKLFLALAEGAAAAPKPKTN